MADITIADLRDEVLDRLDNLVGSGSLPENIRQKITGITRVTRSMNYAFDLFVKQAPSDSVAGLVSIVSLAADTNVGDSGVQSGLKTWLWPTKALFDREDGGVLTIILDEQEFPANPEETVPVNTIRMMSRNKFYKDSCANAFNLDPQSGRIYTAKGVTAKARIVSEPFPMDDNDEYVNGDEYPPATIPVDESYLPDIAAIAVAHLIEVGSGISSQQPIEQDQEE